MKSSGIQKMETKKTTLSNSDEWLIHPYLDDQLSEEEKRAFEEKISSNHELQNKLHDYKYLKQLVPHAYDKLNIPEPDFSAKKQYSSHRKTCSWKPMPMIAAGLIGVFFGVIGVFGANQIWHNQALTPTTQFLSETTSAFSLNQNRSKFMIHVDSDDPIKHMAAIEKIMQIYSENESNQLIEVDVITNYKGVYMYDINNPYSSRLKILAEQYPTLNLYACQRSLYRARQSSSPYLKIIDQVNSEKPAVDAMAERMNSGWKYIKI